MPSLPPYKADTSHGFLRAVLATMGILGMCGLVLHLFHVATRTTTTAVRIYTYRLFIYLNVSRLEQTKLSHTLVLGHPQSGNMVVRRDVFKNKRSTKIFRFARLASRNIVHRVAATALLSAVIISLPVLTFFFFPKKKPIFVQRSHVSHSKFSNTIQRKVLQNSSRARTRNPVIDYRAVGAK